MNSEHAAAHGTFGDRMNMHSDKELSDLLDFSAVSVSMLCGVVLERDVAVCSEMGPR